MTAHRDICDQDGDRRLVGEPWEAATWPPGWWVRHVGETGSTNDDLLAAARAGTADDRTVLVADHQTAGRGRLDRRWDAPRGANLLVSLLFVPVPDPAAALTQRVAVAAAVAAERAAPGVRIALKWPNDLLADGRKVGGILAQRSGEVAVVGLGFNTAWSPDGAGDLGGAVSPAGLLAALLAELDGLPAEIAPAYRARLDTIGRRVRVELPGGDVVVGTATDLDVAGRLIVVDDGGGRHVLDVGDVVHLRPDAG